MFESLEPRQFLNGQNLLENPSFELPAVTSPTGWQYNSSPINNWTSLTSNSIELQTSAFLGVTPPAGNQYCELASDGQGAIGQTVAVTPGASYHLSVALASRPDTPSSDNQLGMKVVNASTNSVIASLPSPAQAPDSGWATVPLDFTVPSGCSQISVQFADAGDGGTLGTFIDNAQLVQTSAVVSINNVTVAAPTTAGQTATATFTLNVNGAGTTDTTINWATADGADVNHATAGTDYVAATGSITIAAGTTGPVTETIPVTVNAVTAPGADKTFNVALSSSASSGNLAATFAVPSGSSGTAGVGVGTITNSIANPSVTVSNVTVSEPAPGDPAVMATFTVTLNKAPYSTLNLSYTTANGTAQSGASPGAGDYDSKSGTLTFSPSATGPALTQTVTVLVNPSVHPSTDGSPLNFFLNVNATSGTIDVSASTLIGTGSILQAPRISVGNATAVSQATNGPVTATFPVTVTGNVTSPITINYTTGNISATAGTDYTAVTDSLVVTSAGQRSITVSVLPYSATSWAGAGPNKTFSLQLTGTSSGILIRNGISSPGYAIGTILPPPSASVADAGRVLEAVGATAKFTVTLTAASSVPVTIAYTLTDGTAKGGVDYTSTPGSITIPATKTQMDISVPILTTPGHQGDRTFYVNLSQPTGSSGSGTANAVIGSPAKGMATIYDNDSSIVVDPPCGCSSPNINGNGDVDTGATGATGNVSSASGSSGTITTPSNVILDQNSGSAVIFAGGTMFDTNQNASPVVTMPMVLPQAGEPMPTSISAQLVYPATSSTSEVDGAPVYYSAADLAAGQTVNLSLQANAASLPTGHYDYQVIVTSTYADGSTTTQTGNGSVDLFNRTNSPYGAGAWIHALDQIVPGDGGVAAVRGDGTAEWFTKNSDGTFMPEAATFNTLVQNGDGTYSLTDSAGDVQSYSSAGLLTASKLANGQTTTYSYTSSGGVANALYQVTDPFGRATTYSYSGGVLSTITDPSGNVTTYTSTTVNGMSNYIASITGPDPGAGEEALVTTFSYNSTGQLTSFTAGGNTTTLGYDFSGAVNFVGNPDGTSQSLSAALVQGLVDTTLSGSSADNLASSAYLTASASATYTDARGEAATALEDQFGTGAVQTDPSGNVAQYLRNALGEITQMIQPNPANPSSPLVTTFSYDAAGNETGAAYPDGSTESWTYDSTFNETTSHTDRDGNVTQYTIDPATGNVLSMTQVHKAADGTSDNLVTGYTYTDSSGALPAGLLLTSTDPNGNVTRNVYYSDPASPEFGQLESTTQAYGTALAATTSYQYDANGNVITQTDPLGRTTHYQYDALSRLVKEIDPPANPADPSTAPVTSYTYDVHGNVLTTADPDGVVTTDTYDAQSQVLTQTVTGAATALTIGLAGQWNLDETSGTTAGDSSGNGNTGTIAGSVSRVAGHAGGNALDFNGSSGAVDLGNPSNLNFSGQITLSAWIKPADISSTGYQEIVSHDYTVSPDAAVYLRIYDGQYQVGSWNGANYLAAYTIPTGDLNQWVQLTGTYDGSSWNLYRDGVLVATSASTVGALAVGTDWTIGDDSAAGDNRVFDGAIQDVSIFSRGLSSAEVAALYSPSALQAVTSYTYDANGNMTSATDPMGRTTTYVYNALDQQTEVIGPSAGGVAPITQYSYDALGRLVKTTDPLGTVTTSTYDSMGNVVSQTVTGASAVASGLVGQWNLDETAGSSVNDSSGNGATGTIDGPVSRVAGHAGGDALDFNGSSGTVDLGNPSNLNFSGQITLSAWIKPADISSTGYQEIITHDYTDSPMAAVYLRIDNGQYEVGSWDGTNYAADFAIPAGDLNQWVQLTGTYDGSSWNLYRDGVLVATSASAQGAMPVGTDWTIGNGTGPGDARVFHGAIQDVSIFDRGLPSAEVAALYASVTIQAVTGYTYDANGNMSSMTDPLGHTTEYVYNDLGQQIQIIQPNPTTGATGVGPTVSFAFDNDGELIAQTDADGNTTEYTYDALGRQTSSIQPGPTTGTAGGGPTTSEAYDLDGELTSVTDALGQVTTYAYDGDGRVISITQPPPSSGMPAPVISYTYDNAGNELSMTDPNGNTTSYEYDGLERQIALIQPNPAGGSGPGSVTGVVYDLDGEQVATIDPLGRTTEYVYNALGQQVLVIAPSPTTGVAGAGPVTSYSYDLDSDLVASTNPDGETTEYVYDGLGRQTEIIQPSLSGSGQGPTTLTTYDLAGDETSLTDPDGNTTTFSYDALNRLVGQSRSTYESATSPNVLVSESFSYDANGNLASQTDYDGRTIAYDYDHLNRLVDEKWMNGSSVVDQFNYTYDADGQLLTAADSNSSYAYTYDGDGRMTSVNNAGTPGAPTVVLASGYDANGNRTSLSATINGTADFLNQYAYDALDEETSVTQQGQSGGNAVAEKRVNIGYQPDGQFSTIARYADLAGTSPVVTSTYGYDAMGRLNSLTQATNSAIIAGYGWTYDLASQILTFTNIQHTDENTGYTYDTNGELIAASAMGEAYTYDANGNRVSAATSTASSTYVTGANNKIANDGTYTYTYDADGNTLTRTNIATGTVDTYTWDYRNRLASVTEADSSGVTQWTVNYTYDVNNELIAREQLDGSGSVVSDQKFVYDGQQIALAFNGSGNLTDRMLWGPAVDQLLAQESVTSLSSAGAVDWALSDNQNTIRDWADDSGNPAGHATYTAYSQQTSATGFASSADLLFGYTGKFKDPLTGLQYNLNRWYDPATGNWLSEDPMGFVANDANLTRYANNVPETATDPSGEVLYWIDSPKAAERDQIVKAYNMTEEEQAAKFVVRPFKSYDEAIKKLSDVVTNNVTDAQFDQLKAKGKVLFDGKPFEGTRAEFSALADRERQSRRIFQLSGDLDDLVAEYQKYLGKADQPWDQLTVSVHGLTLAGKPTGDVRVGNDEVPNADFLQQIKAGYGDSTAAVQVVGCYLGQADQVESVQLKAASNGAEYFLERRGGVVKRTEEISRLVLNPYRTVRYGGEPGAKQLKLLPPKEQYFIPAK